MSMMMMMCDKIFVFKDIVGYLKDGQQAVHIGDSLDAETIVYADNCLQLICSNVGLDIRRSPDCECELIRSHFDANNKKNNIS